MRLAFMGSPDFAVPALRALHAAGVVHGDAALRNAVWRVRGSSGSSGSGDGAVLWLDLEMASLRGSEDFADDAEFEVAAARELAAVAAELRGVREEVEEHKAGAGADSAVSPRKPMFRPSGWTSTPGRALPSLLAGR